MTISVRRSTIEEIERLRELYRQEMNCQIIHDSIHHRPNWSNEYLLSWDSQPIGYASVAVKGPWTEAHSIYEYFLERPYRANLFACFQQLLQACNAFRIETQSNDVLLTNMLLTFSSNVNSEAIIFQDGITTKLSQPDVAFRAKQDADATQIAANELDEQAEWVLEYQGQVAAAGDILYHYNRPYGDIYMKVASKFRRRGLGSYLVQELKRICYAGGSIPAARCNVNNLASRATLQKAGFVPCAHIVYGTIRDN